MFWLSKMLVMLIISTVVSFSSVTQVTEEVSISLRHNLVLANNEAYIGCPTVGELTLAFMRGTLHSDGEVCRPERFANDTVFLEASLYSMESSGYIGKYNLGETPPMIVAQGVQSPPDTFVCDSPEGIAGYLSGGLESVVGTCEPMLWGDIATWEVNEPLPSEYCAAMLGTTIQIVEVYKVVVAGEVRFAITDCLDEHLSDHGLWESEVGATVEVAVPGGDWQAEMRVFHRINMK